MESSKRRHDRIIIMLKGALPTLSYISHNDPIKQGHKALPTFNLKKLRLGNLVKIPRLVGGSVGMKSRPVGSTVMLLTTTQCTLQKDLVH